MDVVEMLPGWSVHEHRAMMDPLDLKLLRDLGRMKGHVVAVSFVMACGLQ